jgi:hypothetical protein
MEVAMAASEYGDSDARYVVIGADTHAGARPGAEPDAEAPSDLIAHPFEQLRRAAAREATRIHRA